MRVVRGFSGKKNISLESKEIESSITNKASCTVERIFLSLTKVPREYFVSMTHENVYNKVNWKYH